MIGSELPNFKQFLLCIGASPVGMVVRRRQLGKPVRGMRMTDLLKGYALTVIRSVPNAIVKYLFSDRAKS